MLSVSHTHRSLLYSKVSRYFQTIAELRLSVHESCPSVSRPFSQTKIDASAHAQFFLQPEDIPSGTEALTGARSCCILGLLSFKGLKSLYTCRLLCRMEIWARRCFAASTAGCVSQNISVIIAISVLVFLLPSLPSPQCYWC